MSQFSINLGYRKMLLKKFLTEIAFSNHVRSGFSASYKNGFFYDVFSIHRKWPYTPNACYFGEVGIWYGRSSSDDMHQ